MPRLTNPPNCGKEFWETTRNGSVRWAPRVRGDRDVDDRPDVCAHLVHGRDAEADLVVADRRMSLPPSRRGAGPLTAVPTMPPTIFPLTVTSPAPTPLVIAVTARVALQAREQGGARRMEADLLRVAPQPWASPSDG